MQLNEVLKFVYSDAFRYTGSDDRVRNIKLFFTNPYFRFIVWFRFSKIDIAVIRLMACFFKSLSSSKTNIQIHKGVPIGYGLFIPHGNVIVNSTASIGSNCTLCQFSTLGSVKSNAANIGDNVYVGPNVCIVENVEVESNVIIGAGSVVLKDIRKNQVVAGVPAKVIKTLTNNKENNITYNYYFK